MTQEMGFYEEPRNGEGIVRSRTTRQVRAWDIPRSQKALEAFNAEIGKQEFPGLYVLFDDKSNSVYVGEAKNVYNRMKTHMTAPEDNIKDWNRATVITDGRPAALSDMNDTVVRKSLELHLIKLLRANKKTVVAQGEPQIPNQHQKYHVESLRGELDFFLLRKNIVAKLLEQPGQEQVFTDELKRILEKSGKVIKKWGAQEAIIDGSRVFIRPGSNKPKGWQITFRDRFKESLEKGQGSLLVSRDGVLLIPLSEVSTVVEDPNAYKQNTIDIWVTFGSDKVTLSYKDKTIDVSQFRLLQR